MIQIQFFFHSQELIKTKCIVLPSAEMSRAIETETGYKYLRILDANGI